MNVNRANSVDMRKALELVDAFKQAGILFVPIPVFNENDLKNLLIEIEKRLEQIEKMISIE